MTKTIISFLLKHIPLILVGTAYFLFVTYWTGMIFSRELHSAAFDSLGQNLLNLDASVEPTTIMWEGFPINGKVYIYFGPFPALLRIIPNILFPDYFGLWARLSCFIAALLSVFVCAESIDLCLRKKFRLTPICRLVLRASAVLAIGFGSPIIYLVSCARIYHEAVLWGLCTSVCAIYFLLKIILQQGSKDWSLFLFSACAGASVLARSTFGFPLCIIALFLCLIQFQQVFSNSRLSWKLHEVSFPGAWVLLKAPHLGRRLHAMTGLTVSLLRILLLFSPLGLAVLIQCWYNYNRFGSIFTLIDYRYFYINPKDFGGEFNLARLPSAFLNYFSISLDYFRMRIPYIRMPNVHYLNKEIFFDWKEQVLSLSLGSPWLLCGGILGIITIIRAKKASLSRIILCSFALQALLISSFYFVTERYAAEFIPLFLFASLIFLARASSRKLLKASFMFLFLLLSLLSAFISTAATIHWLAYSNGDGSIDFKQSLLRAFYSKVEMPPLEGKTLAISSASSKELDFAPLRPKDDMAVDGSQLSLKGYSFSRGIGVHANTSMTFAVPEGSIFFRVIVGISDSALACPGASATFRIIGNHEQELLPLIHLNTEDPPFLVKVDVTKQQFIRLEINDANDGFDCDHVNLAMPEFVF